MYHPESTDQIRKRQQSLVRLLTAIVLCLIVAAVAFVGARSAVREQSALSMRTAILERAKQCCAVEGAYPQSLEYLVQHYGLAVNEREYLVTYECYADNVVPSVAVLPR